jgi:hypothetical protein
MNGKIFGSKRSELAGFRPEFRRVFVLLLLLAVAGCEEPPATRWEGWDSYGSPGVWPVAKVVDHLQFGDISFYPAPGVSFRQLVDLSIFGGFWPGMTGTDAERAGGEPAVHYERDGEEYWIYRRNGGRVLVAHKYKGSLFFGRWWRLEAELDPPIPPAALLHPSIVQALPHDVNRFTVMVMNHQRHTAVSVHLTDGKIVGLDWIDNPGSEGARDRDPAGAGAR